VYAVALHSAGQGEQAMTALKKILADHPDDRDSLQAIIAFARDAGDLAVALDYARRLAQIVPDDQSVKSFVDNLQRQVEGPAAR
jgi:Flp pilus assembly protein TadD